MPSYAATEGATDGATDGAFDAGALALGDDAAPPHAAKTIVSDAANTAPLTNHLFGVWDMLLVSSFVLQARTACLPVRPVERGYFLAEAEAPGAGRRKPSISGSGRHASSASRIRGTRA